MIISQMLRKSVETRDWVNTIEPRNVRAVMKRVVEDTTSIDVQVPPHQSQRCILESTSDNWDGGRGLVNYIHDFT